MRAARLVVLATALLAAGPSTGGASDPATPSRIGQPAPSFRLPDLQGRTVSLEDFRGRFLVLHFGTSW